jgi:hypothetical protein
MTPHDELHEGLVVQAERFSGAPAAANAKQMLAWRQLDRDALPRSNRASTDPVDLDPPPAQPRCDLLRTLHPEDPGHLT